MQKNISNYLLASVIATGLVGCGSDDDKSHSNSSSSVSSHSSSSASSSSLPAEIFHGVNLSLLSRYHSGIFGKSAAEIPAFHTQSQRVFVVNADKGELDVIKLTDVLNPVFETSIATESLKKNSQVNSVALYGDWVAIAIESSPKTDHGLVAIYDANTLELLSTAAVGALPDMLAFTPDGKKLLVANEGEPNDNYSIDPEGSISIIDLADIKQPQVTTANFHAFNDKRNELLASGVRIYGPNASVAQDLEPEYIAISADSKKAWVTLQENNALAHINLESHKVIAITPLGAKDYGINGQGIDASDSDGKINIQPWPGVKGLYLPDAIVRFTQAGTDYLITANEGDARAWGEDNSEYFAGDASQGFVEEFRVKHLVHKEGFDRRLNDDLPAHLRHLAAGALLNPETFSYCGAEAGNPRACRDDELLGRLNITWTMGYRQHADGTPVMFSKAGTEDPAGDRLMYDNLYSYGARSISIWTSEGNLVWDSGDFFEQYLASDECKLGSDREILCKDFFNTGHDEGNAFDSRSDAKGPEPEGLALGYIANTPVVFVGLERMGGIMVFDVSTPTAPKFLDYFNTRENYVSEDVAEQGHAMGDLGPEGLIFIPKDQSPNGENLLIVGNEVSGTTAIYQVDNIVK